jgi:hypothetical protein
MPLIINPQTGYQVTMNPHSTFSVNTMFSTSSFLSFTFTNSGAIGPVGPTLLQALSAYSSRPDIISGLSISGPGYQSFVIPNTGTYRFTVNGASGGVWTTSPMSPVSSSLAPTIDGYKRPPGALIRGSYNLTIGQIITMVIGQGGGDDDNVIANCPGGGGGTFVTLGSYAAVLGLTDTLLFVAGGAGGAGYQVLDSASDNYSAGIGQISTFGAAASEGSGTFGNGAPTIVTSNNSSGGAGYLSGPGLATTTDFTTTIPTNAVPVGFRQGAKGGSFLGLTRGWGGFGGGGQGANSTTSDDDKGGGGGYSGGAHAFDADWFGGGGGSYTNPSATSLTLTAGGNTTSRHGSVLLEFLG